MSDWEIVRRPRLESHSGSDPSADWRRFVLEQVGYDEAGRERSARRGDVRRALRGFSNGLMFGLAVYGLAFTAVLVSRAWREGRFDRYLPKAAEVPMPPPQSVRWAHDVPPEAGGPYDLHDSKKPAPPPSDADDDGADGN